MYTRPPVTIGVASKSDLGAPATTGGVQCHATLGAMLPAVNAEAALSEVCCGPPKYCVHDPIAEEGATNSSNKLHTGTQTFFATTGASSRSQRAERTHYTRRQAVTTRRSDTES